MLQPGLLVGDDVARAAQVELLPQWRVPEFGVHAVYPSRRHVAPKLRRMVEYLAQAPGATGSAPGR